MKIRQGLWPIFVLCLAFGLRLYLMERQSIWWDEGHSIFVASHPIPQIPTLPAMDVHPPAYFALLNLWLNTVGRSEFSLRFLSLIFSMLTVALMWRFAAFIAARSPSAPLIAALLSALSPMYIAYAQEVRSYAMLTCLALSSTFILWRLLFPGHQQDTPKKQLLTLYIIFTTACLYTHYFTIFLLLFQNLLWLLWLLNPKAKVNPKHNSKTLLTQTALWVGSQITILLLFTPQLLLAWRQVSSYTNPNLMPPRLSYFITHSWQAYTVGLNIDPTLARWGMGIVAGVLIISWGLLALTMPASNRAKLFFNFLLLIAWFFVPLLAYFVVLQKQPSYEPRYLMLVTPPIFLLLALGLSQLRTTHDALRFTFYILLTLLLSPFLLGTYHYYTNETFFKDDSAGVAEWLTNETTPNDIVYVDVPHPFHYYDQQIPAPTRYLFVDIHTIAAIFTREVAHRERLYWVTWWGSDTDPRGVVPFLAEKAGQPGDHYDFKGYKVRWFDLSSPETSFSLPNQLTPAKATFGDVIRLDGIAFGGTQNQSTTPANEPIWATHIRATSIWATHIGATSIWATLHFTLLRNSDINYKVSLRLRDEAGQIVAQLDQDLLNDRHFRTSAWPLVDPALNQAINVYLMPLPPDTPMGAYQLEAVIYNAEPPYPSEGVTGHETPDGIAAIIGRLTVVP